MEIQEIEPSELLEKISEYKKLVTEDFWRYLKVMSVYTGIIILGYDNLQKYVRLVGFRDFILPMLIWVTTIYILGRMLKNTRILDKLFQRGFNEKLVKPRVVSAIAIEAIYVIVVIITSLIIPLSITR